MECNITSQNKKDPSKLWIWMCRVLSFCKKKAVAIGDVAPDFNLPSQVGKPVALNEYRGKKNVVLYFYPKDDTYNCIVESSEFRDLYKEFDKKNTEVIGVSSDSPDSHVKFAKKYNLPFPLLSDSENNVRELYGVQATLGFIPGRVTFVIDKKGMVRHVFNSQFDPKSHVSQALNVLNTVE